MQKLVLDTNRWGRVKYLFRMTVNLPFEQQAVHLEDSGDDPLVVREVKLLLESDRDPSQPSVIQLLRWPKQPDQTGRWEAPKRFSTPLPVELNPVKGNPPKPNAVEPNAVEPNAVEPNPVRPDTTSRRKLEESAAMQPLPAVPNTRTTRRLRLDQVLQTGNFDVPAVPSSFSDTGITPAPVPEKLEKDPRSTLNLPKEYKTFDDAIAAPVVGSGEAFYGEDLDPLPLLLEQAKQIDRSGTVEPPLAAAPHTTTGNRAVLDERSTAERRRRTVQPHDEIPQKEVKWSWIAAAAGLTMLLAGLVAWGYFEYRYGGERKVERVERQRLLIAERDREAAEVRVREAEGSVNALKNSLGESEKRRNVAEAAAALEKMRKEQALAELKKLTAQKGSATVVKLIPGKPEIRYKEVRVLAAAPLFDLQEALEGLTQSRDSQKAVLQKTTAYLSEVERSGISEKNSGQHGAEEKKLLTDLAQAHARLGDLALLQVNDPPAAVSAYGNALRLARKSGRDQDATLGQKLADAQLANGQKTEAMQTLQEAQRTILTDPKQDALLKARLYERLASAASSDQQAQGFYKAGLNAIEKLPSADAAKVRGRLLAKGISIEEGLGNRTAAEQLKSQSTQELDRAAGQFPEDVSLLRSAAEAKHRQAEFALQKEQLTESAQLVSAEIDLWDRIGKAELSAEKANAAKRNAANRTAALADILLRQEKPIEALSSLRQAQVRAKAISGGDTNLLQSLLSKEADLLRRLYRPNESMAPQRQALSLAESRAVISDDAEIIISVAREAGGLAESLRDAGRFAEAMEQYKFAETWMQRALKQNPLDQGQRDLAAWQSDHAALLIMSNHRAAAATLLESAIQLLDSKDQESRRITAIALLRLAVAKPEVADQSAEKGLAMLDQLSQSGFAVLDAAEALLTVEPVKWRDATKARKLMSTWKANYWERARKFGLEGDALSQLNPSSASNIQVNYQSARRIVLKEWGGETVREVIQWQKALAN
jgi:hypothetical protein